MWFYIFITVFLILLMIFLVTYNNYLSNRFNIDIVKEKDTLKSVIALINNAKNEIANYRKYYNSEGSNCYD